MQLQALLCTTTMLRTHAALYDTLTIDATDLGTAAAAIDAKAELNAKVSSTLVEVETRFPLLVPRTSVTALIPEQAMTPSNLSMMVI